MDYVLYWYNDKLIWILYCIGIFHLNIDTRRYSGLNTTGSGPGGGGGAPRAGRVGRHQEVKGQGWTRYGPCQLVNVKP